MRKLVASLIIFISLSGFACANADPSVFLEGITKDIISLLEKNKEALRKDSKFAEEIARKHILPVIDKETFSRRTLGSKTWASLSDKQKQAFIDGFINRVINKYAKGLSLYDGQNFVFQKAEISAKTGNARVKSAMNQADSEPLDIYYYLSQKSGDWLITNIIVAGTDMRKSYKNQFLPRIQEIGIEKFIEELNMPETEQSEEKH